MRLIDADELMKSVLKWLPPDPCGQEEKEYPFETDICASLLMEIEKAPTVEPEYSMDEWCTDCKEYDHERHCCPRFNRVIRETVDEVKSNQWIPCSEKMPESDGTYLVYAPDYQGGSSSAKEWHNGVMFAKFKHGKWSVEVGYYNRPGCVRAWMPLPDPYQEGEE